MTAPGTDLESSKLFVGVTYVSWLTHHYFVAYLCLLIVRSVNKKATGDYFKCTWPRDWDRHMLLCTRPSRFSCEHWKAESGLGGLINSSCYGTDLHQELRLHSSHGKRSSSGIQIHLQIEAWEIWKHLCSSRCSRTFKEIYTIRNTKHKINYTLTGSNGHVTRQSTNQKAT